MTITKRPIVCPVYPELTFAHNDNCHVRPCMNNVDGVCHRDEIVHMDGDAASIAKLKGVSTAEVAQAASDLQVALVASRFFEVMFDKSLLDASHSELDTLCSSAHLFHEWNTSSHTFAQITRMIGILRSRL